MWGFPTLNEYAFECHQIAKDRGFWDDRDVNDPLKALAEMMLITTEVAEAAEAIRSKDKDNLGEELADIVIRTFDSAVARGIDIEQEINKKMKKNRARPYLHGKRA